MIEIWYLARIFFGLTLTISGLFAVSLVAKAYFMSYRRDMLLLMMGFVLLIVSLMSTTIFTDLLHLSDNGLINEMVAIVYFIGTIGFFFINASFFTKK